MNMPAPTLYNDSYAVVTSSKHVPMQAMILALSSDTAVLTVAPKLGCSAAIANAGTRYGMDNTVLSGGTDTSTSASAVQIASRIVCSMRPIAEDLDGSKMMRNRNASLFVSLSMEWKTNGASSLLL